MARGPRKLNLTFGSASLTHYGGVYLLHRFFGRLRLKKLFTHQTRLIQRNNRYSVGEMLLALLYPIILGLERIETAHTSFAKMVSFSILPACRAIPDATTLRRFLLRIAPTALPQLRAVARSVSSPRMTDHSHDHPTRLIFDVDSTVSVVYGQQEQARIGYNPIKRGRPSYHPLLCFEGQSKDFWHGELRPGDAHTASGTRNLLTACFAKIPSRSPVGHRPRRQRVLRSHAGRVAGGARSAAGPFVIVARLTAPIKRKLAHLRYVSPSRGSRGHRIPLPAHPVAPALSLRRHPTASARRT